MPGKHDLHDQSPDQDFLTYLVKEIADDKDEVIVTRTVDAMGVLLTLQVSKRDMGKIIGKNGQTARALRVLLRVFGAKHDERVNLKILEPGTGEEVAKDMDNAA